MLALTCLAAVFAAAADAARTVNAFARGKQLDATVTADPVSNTVRVAAGDAAGRQRVAELLAALDRQPPMLSARMTVVRVPAGFADDVGLGDDGGSGWALTPREARVLTAAIRRTAAADVISRPRLTLADNQTGFATVEVGAGELTTRLSPDGATVVVRLDSQLGTSAAGGPVVARDVQTVQTTGAVPVGGTLVLRGPLSKPAGGRRNEFLVVATIERVTPSPDR